MPIYLAPVIGTGTERDPIRAPYLGDDPRIGWIHMGPPGTNLGSALLYLPTSVGDVGFDKVCDEDVRETTPMVTRSRIDTRLIVTTSKATLRDLVGELLLDLGDIRIRWGGVRNFPSRARSRYEIYLGAIGCVYDLAVPRRPSTQSFDETWAGGDGTTLTIAAGRDNDWTEQVDDLAVTGGVLHAVANVTEATARCESALDTADQRHKATFALANIATSNHLRITVRHTDQDNAYRIFFERNNGSFVRRTQKIVSASVTLFSGDTTDPGASGTFEINVDGTTITGLLNDVTILGPATDGSPELTTVRTGGLQIRFSTTDSNATLDNHTIADVVSAAGAPLAAFHRHYAGMRI